MLFMDVSRRARPSVEALEDRSLPSAAGGLSVMTYNLNEGTDFIPLLSATRPQDVPAAVTQTYDQVVASDIPDRAMGLARVIAQAQPTLAGLQEAAQYTVNGTLKYDLLGSLLTDLAALGKHYAVAVLAPTFQAQAPDSKGEIIGFRDENVILARTDLLASQLTLGNAQHGLFAASASLSIGGAPLSLTRSWASVDVTSGGQTFRFLTAHLEDFDPTVRTAQANELLAGPAHTTLPVVFVGDLNSPAAPQGPDSGAYNTLITQGGFTDAWSRAHPHDAGYTWGDGDPSNPTRVLTQRIDVVLVRGGITAGGASLAGGRASDRIGGVWPSDHDGVVATVTQTVNFDAATGVLSVESDTQSGGDSVTIKAAGARGDGSTGVTLVSNLTNGQAVTYGDASHPVKQIVLDLKDGRDTVTVGDLAAVSVSVREGNGNDSVQVGKTAGAVVIGGDGSDSVVLGGAARGGTNVVVLGDGARDAVTILAAGTTGPNEVRVGNGAADAVTVKADGFVGIDIGGGGGALIDAEGAGYHLIGARRNARATITDVGSAGLIVAARDAAVTVDGARASRTGFDNGVLVLLLG